MPFSVVLLMRFVPKPIEGEASLYAERLMLNPGSAFAVLANSSPDDDYPDDDYEWKASVRVPPFMLCRKHHVEATCEVYTCELTDVQIKALFFWEAEGTVSARTQTQEAIGQVTHRPLRTCGG